VIRANAWAKLQARQKRRAWARKNAVLLTAVVSTYAAVGVVVYFMQSPVARPYLAGGLVVGGAWLVSWLIAQDGLDRLRIGVEAEAWTSAVLRKARRHGWVECKSIPFEGFDVDHVWVGSGGVFALETKYTSMPWRSVDTDLIVPLGDPVGQALSAARKIRLLLGSAGCDVEVTPVLVVWGSGAEGVRRSQVRGVLIVPGPALKDWILNATKQSERIPPDQARHAVRTLDHFKATRLAYERRTAQNGEAAKTA
jgi:hypothetical protein